MQLLFPLGKGHLFNVAIISWQIWQPYKRGTTVFGMQRNGTRLFPEYKIRTMVTGLGHIMESPGRFTNKQVKHITKQNLLNMTFSDFKGQNLNWTNFSPLYV